LGAVSRLRGVWGGACVQWRDTPLLA